MPRPPFALLQREWYVAARRIKVLRPSTESLIGAVIPLSLEGDLLTLELPESQPWLDVAGPQRRDVEMALALLFGCTWRVRFVRGQDIAETHGGDARNQGRRRSKKEVTPAQEPDQVLGATLSEPHAAKSNDGPRAPSRPRFEPTWHPVPKDFEMRLGWEMFAIIDRTDGRIVQAGWEQPDDLVRLRTTVEGIHEAQAARNSTADMSVGYRWTAPRITRRIDNALRDPYIAYDAGLLISVLKGARGALAYARRRTWLKAEDRKSGGWLVQGGLPSLGKRR